MGKSQNHWVAGGPLAGVGPTGSEAQSGGCLGGTRLVGEHLLLPCRTLREILTDLVPWLVSPKGHSLEGPGAGERNYLRPQLGFRSRPWPLF